MRPWARAGAVLAVVVAVDQLTKALVRGALAVGEERDGLPVVDLVHVQNRGVAFSALEDQTALVGIVIALAVLAIGIYFARHVDRPLMWLPTGLLAGGALGNVVDRLTQGHVTDFVKLPSWPAFNVADMAITVGVVALLWVVERSERREAADARA